MPLVFSGLSRRLPALLFMSFISLQADAAKSPESLGEAYGKPITAEGITEYRLDNGLRIVLAPDAAQTVTAVDLTYRVGSRNEHEGQGGMSHLLEHLVLAGKPGQPAIADEFQRRGMDVKASTSADRTRYVATFQSSHMDLAWYLGWHADAMLHTAWRRADVDAALPVIFAELEVREKTPERVLRQKMRGAAFHWHSYGNDPMGTHADMANVRLDRLQAYQAEYYQPDNAVLTIAGRFDAPLTLSAIADTLGKLPRPRRNVPEDYRVEPLQDGNHAVTLRRVGGYPLVATMYHVPATGSRDHTLLLLAADMLAASGAHRLQDELVATGLAGKVSTQALGWRDYGLIEFRAALKPSMDTESAQRVLNRTVETLRLHPYTQEELNQARRRWLDTWTRTLADPQALTDALSKASVNGDWRLIFLERDRVRDATLVEVQRVADHYLARANRNQGRYIPTAAPEPQPASAPVDLGPELQRYETDVD
jgi:predicted Zn-dependent peptidase